MKQKNINHIVLLILSISFLISCSTSKKHINNQNISEYEKFFDYIQQEFNDNACIFKDISDHEIYLKGIYEKKPDVAIKDKYLLNFIQSNRIFSVELDNNISDTVKQKKITIEFESTPFIQKRKFLVKYLNSKREGNDNEKKINDNIYFFEWKPITY